MSIFIGGYSVCGWGQDKVTASEWFSFFLYIFYPVIFGRSSSTFSQAQAVRGAFLNQNWWGVSWPRETWKVCYGVRFSALFISESCWVPRWEKARRASFIGSVPTPGEPRFTRCVKNLYLPIICGKMMTMIIMIGARSGVGGWGGHHYPTEEK